MEKKEIDQKIKTEVTGLLHLARKAGKVIFGFDACQRSCLNAKAKLILAAKDLSSRQRSSLKTLAEANNIKFLEFGTKRFLGESFKQRDVGIICIEDRNFANGIVKKF